MHMRPHCFSAPCPYADISPMNEKEIIAEIAAITKPTANLTNGPSSDLSGLIQGIGDDCAVIRRAGTTVLLLSKDTLVESVHFDLSWHSAKLLGRKTVSVNVSDIAAMGGKPLFYFFHWACHEHSPPNGCGTLQPGLQRPVRTTAVN